MTDSGGQQPVTDAQLATLLGATGDLIDADSERELAAVAVEAATDLLDLPFSVVWRVTQDRSALRAVAVSQPLEQHVETPANPGETMVHERGGWMWELYEAEDPRIVTVAEEDVASDTPLHGGVTVPLGDYGMLTAGTASETEPTPQDRRLAAILGRNLQAALGRLEQQQRLEAQRDAMETVNRIVHHDISNDLQPVVGYADRLDEAVDSDLPERIIRCAESAVDRTETASQVVEAMLQEESALEAVPLRVTLLTRLDAVDAAYPDASVDHEGSVPDVSVVADELLGSVFENLVENAVEHNDTDSPTVTVTTDTDGGRATVTVADDGPGIPRAVRERFADGSPGVDADLGVGLSLVATLVDRYGGDLTVADRDDGTGAAVTVSLPLAT